MGRKKKILFNNILDNKPVENINCEYEVVEESGFVDYVDYSKDTIIATFSFTDDDTTLDMPVIEE